MSTVAADRRGWQRALVAPARRPRLVLLIAVVIAGLSVWSITRTRASASIEDLLGSGEPAAAALGRVLRDFSSTGELLILASLAESESGKPGEAPAANGIRSGAGGRETDAIAPEGESAGGGGDDPERGFGRLLEYAARLSGALRESPECGPMVRRAAYALSPEVMEFIKNEAVPAGLLYVSDEELEALLGRLTPEAMAEQFRRDEAMIAQPGAESGAMAKMLLKDPLRLYEFLSAHAGRMRAGVGTWGGRPEYVSPDGRSVLIRVAGVRPASDLGFAKRLTAAVERVVAANREPGIRVEVSGAYAIASASERAIRGDMIGSVVWSIVIMQGVFLLAYRGVLSFPMAFVPVALGLCAAFGLHTLVSPGLTPLTAVIGAMLAGCGIDYSVYFMSYYESSRARGLEAREAGEDAMVSLAVPLLAACSTSVVGFAAVAASGVRALRDFAMLGAMGLAMALVGAIWVLPAMLSLVSRWGWLGRGGPRVEVGGVIERVCERPRVFVGACAVVAVVAIGLLVGGFAGGKGIRFETDLDVMHPRPNAPIDAGKRIAEKFGAGNSMIVYMSPPILMPSDESQVAMAWLVQAALDRAKEAGVRITGTIGLPMLLPDPFVVPRRVDRIARLDVDGTIAAFDAAVEKSQFRPEAFGPYRVFLRKLLTGTRAPTLETVRKYPELAGMLLGSAREGRDEAGGGGAITMVTVAAGDGGAQDGAAREAAIAKIREALAGLSERGGRGDGSSATLTGLGVVGSDVERMVRWDLPRLMGLACVGIVVLLVVSLRSVRDSALALLPVGFGVVCLLGYMSAAGEKLNMANTVAGPLLLGVGVDYGIFVVAMARQAERAGEGRAGVLSRLGASLHATLVSATMNVIGFGTLAFTSTPAVRSLGRVIAIGVVGCVVGAILVLAPLVVGKARAVGSRG